MKTCTKCGATKALSCFSVNSGNTDGLCGQCKNCVAVKGRAWYLANKDRALASARESKKRNPEKAKAFGAAWRAKHGAEYHRQRRKTHPEEHRASGAKASLELRPYIIAMRLRVPTADLTPELLESKRMAITIKRGLAAINKALTEKGN